MRCAIINTATNMVVNVAEIMPGDGSQDPEGFIHVTTDTGNIGDGWNGSAIVPQVQPPIPQRE